MTQSCFKCGENYTGFHSSLFKSTYTVVRCFWGGLFPYSQLARFPAIPLWNVTFISSKLFYRDTPQHRQSTSALTLFFFFFSSWEPYSSSSYTEMAALQQLSCSWLTSKNVCVRWLQMWDCEKRWLPFKIKLALIYIMYFKTAWVHMPATNL